MTQREKIEMLKSTIAHLYEKEGRSKSYISRLLEVDRKILSEIINKEWELKQGRANYLTPSNQKFLNKHRNLIKSRLDNDVLMKDIAGELEITGDYLRKIVYKDEVLKTALDHYNNRKDKIAKQKKQEQKEKSWRTYDVKDLDGEEWIEILGYEGYLISNKGRIKSYAKTYDDYALKQPSLNKDNGRLYVWIKGKAFQVSRLVAFNFVEGHSEENNTVNHKDGNTQNNCSNNLEWCSQSENNQHAYDDLCRPVNRAYQKHGRFKKIILNNKYEFKTIKALAKFIDKSETQVRRYIDKECKSDYTFEFIY